MNTPDVRLLDKFGLSPAAPSLGSAIIYCTAITRGDAAQEKGGRGEGGYENNRQHATTAGSNVVKSASIILDVRPNTAREITPRSHPLRKHVDGKGSIQRLIV